MRESGEPGQGSTATSVRPLLVDVPIAVVLAWVMWLAAQFGHGFGGAHGPPWRDGGPPQLFADQLWWWPVPGVLVTSVGVALRRSRPRWGLIATIAGASVYLAIGGPVPAALAGPVLAVHALAGRLDPRRWWPYGLVLLALLVGALWRHPIEALTRPGTYAGMLLGTAALTVSALVALLRAGRRESQRHQYDDELRRVAYEERLRVAREVHDVVGHSLSVISLQAGVALHVLDARPDQAGAALAAIRTSSHDALAELRHTLGVFRDGEAGPRAPAPDLARIDDLATALRSAGRQVTVHRDVPAGTAVPAGLQQTAYRIAQEAVTNVVRHTERAAAAVVVAIQGTDLVVTVTDDGPVLPGPVTEGNGLHGMRERVAAVGGSLTVSVVARGGLRVEAQLPLDGEGQP